MVFDESRLLGKVDEKLEVVKSNATRVNTLSHLIFLYRKSKSATRE